MLSWLINGVIQLCILWCDSWLFELNPDQSVNNWYKKKLSKNVCTKILKVLKRSKNKNTTLQITFDAAIWFSIELQTDYKLDCCVCPWSKNIRNVNVEITKSTKETESNRTNRRKTKKREKKKRTQIVQKIARISQSSANNAHSIRLLLCITVEEKKIVVCSPYFFLLHFAVVCLVFNVEKIVCFAQMKSRIANLMPNETKNIYANE